MKKIKVAIADDQRLFRKGIGSLLSSFASMELLFEAENGEHLLTMVNSNCPDVVLMDLDMPVMNGIEATERLLAMHPDIRVIIVSVHDEPRFVAHMVEKGVHGYLDKNAEPREVEIAIAAVVQNGFYFNRMMMNAMRKGLAEDEPKLPSRSAVSLTPREKEVLNLICHEYTNAEIAEKLFLSMRTVDGHRTNLLQKTGARNTAGLVVYAITNSLMKVHRFEM